MFAELDDLQLQHAVQDSSREVSAGRADLLPQPDWALALRVPLRPTPAADRPVHGLDEVIFSCSNLACDAPLSLSVVLGDGLSH